MRCVELLAEKLEKWFISDVDYEGEELTRVRQHYEEKFQRSEEYYQDLLSIEQQKVKEYVDINETISDEMRALEELYSKKHEEARELVVDNKRLLQNLKTSSTLLSAEYRTNVKLRDRIAIITEYAAVITSVALFELFYLLLD